MDGDRHRHLNWSASQSVCHATCLCHSSHGYYGQNETADLSRATRSINHRVGRSVCWSIGVVIVFVTVVSVVVVVVTVVVLVVIVVFVFFYDFV